MKFRKIAFALFLSILSFIGYSQINVGNNFAIIYSAPIDTRMQVADLTARDAILWRYEGLSVYVISNQTNYQLRGGTTNANWVTVFTSDFTSGTGITLTGNTFSHTPHTGDAIGATSLTVVAIQGRTLASTMPTGGDVLGWNGSAWAPATAFSNYATGSGLLLSNNTFSALNSLALWNANQLQGTPVSTLAPSNNTQVLKYDGTNWIPTNEVVYTSGTGITLNANTFSHTAHTGDAVGATSLTVVAIQGVSVSTTVPLNSQLLKYNGTNWIPTNEVAYAAGTGITLSANTFSHTAHTGDAVGATSLTVVAIQGVSVSTTAPLNSQLLKYNGTNWIPTNEVAYAAGTGITLSANTFSHTAHTGDAVGATSLTVVALQGVGISSTAPTTTQLLRYNGTNWVPSNETAYAAGTGINLTANTFINTGDLSSINELQNLSYVPATRALGISTGTGVTLPLFTPTEPGLVPAATTGSAFIFLNGAGAWTAPYSAGSGITLTGTVFSHTAHTGDALGETSLTVVAIQGRTLASTTPTNGDILAWNGTAWAPATAFSNYATGSGISLSGNTFSALNSSAIWNANQLQGTPVSTLAPSNTQVLRYNGTNWIPSNEVVYAAGAGLSLVGNTFTNTGDDLSSLNELQNLSYTIGTRTIGISSGTGAVLPLFATVSTDAGLVSGSNGAGASVYLNGAGTWSAPPGTNYDAGTGITLTSSSFFHTAHTGDATGSTSLTVVALQGRSVVTTAPGANEILKWNGSAWAPAADDNVTYSAGTGLSLSGTVFANTGDLSTVNELQNLTYTPATRALGITTGSGVTLPLFTSTADGLTPLSGGGTTTFLRADGAWSAPIGTTYESGVGITLTSNTFSHTAHTGDATGATSLTVVAIQGRSVTSTIPTNGDVITWDTTTSTWKPAQTTTGLYNGSRVIKRGSWPGGLNMNTGTTGSVKSFLDAVFFPFVSATISINGNLLYEIGTTNSVTISGSTTKNDETIFSLGRVDRTSPAVSTIYTFGSATTYSTSYTFAPTQAVPSSQNEQYRVYQTVGNNGTPIEITNGPKFVQSVYPYLHGVSTINLSAGGTAAYAAFNPAGKIIQAAGPKSVTHLPIYGYLYFMYPASYPSLTSILDQNNFEQITNYNKFTVNITSVGLVNNWTVTYYIYQSSSQTQPTGAGWLYQYKP